jgi:hypothetical protein
MVTRSDSSEQSTPLVARGHRTYRFVRADAELKRAAMTVPVRLRAVSLDCPHPHDLATFYAALTGSAILEDTDDFARLDLGSVFLDLLRVEDYRPPSWPSQTVPQQAHLDFAVTDLDEGEAWARRVGAISAAVQPDPSAWRVLLDPAGHPFCVVLWPQ